MLGSAKEVVSEKMDKAKTRVLEETALKKEEMIQGVHRAKEKAIERVESTARELVGGLDQLESDIANHYLDQLKYGLPGSDGSCFSNFIRYTGNHHETLSICFADRRNPYNRKNRFITFWNKVALAFLLSVGAAAYIDPKNSSQEYLESFVIACILTPYGLLLDSLARCSYWHKANHCVGLARLCGSCTLTFFFLLSFVNITGGLFVVFCHEGGKCGVNQASSLHGVVVSFFLSLLLDQILPIALGSLNWIFFSWSGCLCCPTCRFHCPKCSSCFIFNLCKVSKTSPDDDLFEFAGESQDVCLCPSKYKFCPLLKWFPIRFLLNIYNLAEDTYEEDKRVFRKEYPGRVAVDDVNESAPAVQDQLNCDVESNMVADKSPMH